MSLTYEELPRANGAPVGCYHLTHKLPDFAWVGFGFRFCDGKTAEPVTGRVLQRLLVSAGGDYTVSPADRETADAIITFLRERGVAGNARADELEPLFAAMLEPASPDPAAAPASDAESSEAAELAQLEADIAALDAANASTPAAAPASGGVPDSGAAVLSDTQAATPKAKGKK